ncbi:MAG TPA: hypothetical protein PKM63_06770 [Panacibacter sp.]|nr:hypothetical protein [Panacibacter sp.]HNP43971.1 hypothetical protein [Panacibacter sp.]
MKKQFLFLLFAAAMFTATSSFASEKNSTEKAKGYTVRSVIDGRESTSAYNKNGSWVYTIQTYSTDNLDKSIIDKVKEQYANYGVTGIQKIEQPGVDAVYIVYLENKTSLKTVRLSNNEVELVSDYSKS